MAGNGGEPLRIVLSLDGLSEEHQALRLKKALRLQTIEVDTGGQVIPIELTFVIPDIDVTVHEFCSLLTQRVKHRECDM